MTRKQRVALVILGGVAMLPVMTGVVLWLVAWVCLAQPTLLRSKKSQVSVSVESLEKHVRKLSIDFVPRNASHIGNINRTANYIRAEFESIGTGEVTEQWFQAAGRRYRNVSLLLGEGHGPRVVIGAHYDGYGPYPAADDNASGIAGLIELARLMARRPTQTPLEFVAYPLEEPPFFATDDMGSWRHAAEMKRQRFDSCKYMVSLEMIGYFSDERGSQSYPAGFLRWFYPDRGNYIAIVGNTKQRRLIRGFKAGMRGSTPLPVRSLCAPSSIPGIDFSDHRNYWRAGFPAVMITDTAFYRNQAYHTEGDTADRLDYDKMAMVVIGVYEAIQRMEAR